MSAIAPNILHKPSVNVEWGYRQGIGDAARVSQFKGQFANNASAGVAGNFFWNAGYQLRTTTYDVDNGVQTPLTFMVVVGNAPSSRRRRFRSTLVRTVLHRRLLVRHDSAVRHAKPYTKQ